MLEGWGGVLEGWGVRGVSYPSKAALGWRLDKVLKKKDMWTLDGEGIV